MNISPIAAYIDLAKVKSLQDLGLNMCCQATAPFDPLKPTLPQPTWTASCGDVNEGEAGGDGGRRVRPSLIAGARALISSPISD